MACDICGKVGTYFEPLRDRYQTEEIKQACSDCVKEINDHIWKIREMNSKIEQSFIRKFMANMKRRFSSA